MEDVDRLFDRVREELPRYGVVVEYEEGEFSTKLTAPESGKTLYLGEVDIDEDDTSELVVNHERGPKRKGRDQSNVTIDMSGKDIAVRAVLGELGMASGTEPRPVGGKKNIASP